MTIIKISVESLLNDTTVDSWLVANLGPGHQTLYEKAYTYRYELDEEEFMAGAAQWDMWYDYRDVMVHVRFKHPRDAMIFKLTFGLV